jgi:hypothetical protein
VTIEEKLQAELDYGSYDNIKQVREKFLTDGIKIIIAHTIYNEEQFIDECLEDDLKINDLDAIHILDGAWEKQGNGSPVSTDDTPEIIYRFQQRHPEIQVIYEVPKSLWKSEPEKRNYQLDRIRKMFNEPYYVIVKDGDEFFHHTSGRQNSWLKKDLKQWIDLPDNIGLINCNAWYSDISLLTPRMFPSSRRLHYGTQKSMILHDENHSIVADYNPRVRNSGDPKICFVYQSMILVNRYTIRNEQRKKEKIPFVKYIESQDGSGCCTYDE